MIIENMKTVNAVKDKSSSFESLINSLHGDLIFIEKELSNLDSNCLRGATVIEEKGELIEEVIKTGNLLLKLMDCSDVCETIKIDIKKIKTVLGNE
jgi:hypothetical protein